MKKAKKLLWVAMAMLTFAACGDDDKNDDSPKQSEMSFIGKVDVNNGYYYQDSVESKMKFGNSLADFTLYKVRFSSHMPVTIDMSLDNMIYKVNGSDTTISYDSIIPKVAGNPMNKYTMHNLAIKVTKDSIFFNALCGENTSAASVLTIDYKAARCYSTKMYKY